MTLKKRRKSHLLTIRNSQTLGGFFVAIGMFVLLLSFFLATLYILDRASTFDLDAAVTAVVESQGGSAEVGTQEVSAETGTNSLSASGILEMAGRELLALTAVDILSLMARALVILWLGFLLKVTAILVETQIVDFSER